MVVFVSFLFGEAFAVAQAPHDSAADDARSGDTFSPQPEMSQDVSRWTVSAGVILLDRIGSVNQTLVDRVPASVPFMQLAGTPGVEALNSTDLHQGFAAGPSVDLIRRGDNGWDVELSFFDIGGWSSARSIGPDNPPDWLVFRAPRGFLQTQDKTSQAMAWDYSSRLYNAECNLRWNVLSRLTLLAGFRWLDLRENLEGTLEPPTLASEPPFWNTTTTNNLYGFQVGADGKFFEYGSFSMSGVAKAGIFDNNAEESTEVSIFKIARPTSASTNHAAFVGEIDLQCQFQLTSRLVLKAGYQVLWLEGVALAPGQIQQTSLTPPKTEHALGVNCDSGAFYHGVTAGLEFSF
jgi:hypothetical protein